MISLEDLATYKVAGITAEDLRPSKEDLIRLLKNPRRRVITNEENLRAPKLKPIFIEGPKVNSLNRDATIKTVKRNPLKAYTRALVGAGAKDAKANLEKSQRLYEAAKNISSEREKLLRAKGINPASDSIYLKSKQILRRANLDRQHHKLELKNIRRKQAKAIAGTAAAAALAFKALKSLKK